MKAATGELSLTVITVVAIGIIAALFAALWPQIKTKIEGAWNTSDEQLTGAQGNGQHTTDYDFNYIQPATGFNFTSGDYTISVK